MYIVMMMSSTITTILLPLLQIALYQVMHVVTVHGPMNIINKFDIVMNHDFEIEYPYRPISKSWFTAFDFCTVRENHRPGGLKILSRVSQADSKLRVSGPEPPVHRLPSDSETRLPHRRHRDYDRGAHTPLYQYPTLSRGCLRTRAGRGGSCFAIAWRCA